MVRKHALWLGSAVLACALVHGEARAQSVAPRAGAAAPPVAAVVVPWIRSGTLTVDDPMDLTGRRQHVEVLNLPAGRAVDVALASSEFDAWLTVVGPGGIRVDNDDAPGEGTNARVQFVPPTAGAYQVVVTTYALGEFGAYQLTVGAAQPGAALLDIRAPYIDPGAFPTVSPASVAAADPIAQPAPPAGVDPAAPESPAGPAVSPTASPAGAHTYGVFVGVSDYPGPGDIFRGAEDASDLAQAFEQRGIIRAGDAIVLTNGRASIDNVRHAFVALGRRAGPRDTVVFYFGGHGGHGTLALYQESMTSTQLADAMAPFGGRSLVVLDSCYAGTFDPMVRGAPGRLGLFSSRADETSYVAEEVQASGWLIYFVLQAVRGDVPTGSDGQLQWNELTSYLRRSYQLRVGERQHLALAQGAAGNPTLW